METSSLALAIAILEALPTLIGAGSEALTLIENGVASLKAMQAEGRDPTDAEWQAVNDLIAQLQAKIAS